MSGERRTFRWQALLQSAAEAVFVLDRRRRLLFVNARFEQLAEVTCERVRGLLCRRTRSSVSDTLVEDVLATVLTPPPEVLAGASARARRGWRGGAWWDVEFLPLRQEDGYVILGRILPVAREGIAEVPLPERLVALRQRAVGRFAYDLLESRVPAMARLVRQVRLAVEVSRPVLIVGEIGTGKETVARIIHYQGRDRESAFAALDCERLPADAVAAVLADAPGIGTLYLREPAGLPREVQMLLTQRLEQEKPRILAGCNVGVNDLVRQGKILAELANVLSPLTLDVPPLRERKEDLPRLVERMLAKVGMTMALTPAAWDMLRGHEWRGNLTELFAVLVDCGERMTQGRIDANDLPASLRIPARLALEANPPAKPLPLAEMLEQVERRLIEVALRRARGNRTKAAEALGVYRNQLLRRMRALGLEEEEGDAPRP